MRKIRQIHQATYAPIADLVTYSPLPSRSVRMIDPFIFLNHHGHQVYPAHNQGLPFGPHPHRGMETVTFILAGDITHMDSGGHKSVIRAGGIQWMTAGKGLIHAEVSSADFKQHGGDLEILQLWVNLPARLKMTEPRYIGLQSEEIPVVEEDGGKVRVQVVSGTWGDRKAVLDTLSDIHLDTIYFDAGGKLELSLPQTRNIFCYVVRGKLEINEKTIGMRNLVEFENDGNTISFTAVEDSVLLWGHAVPFDEPVVAQGPFVMNTQEEILQAYEDYRAGKFGSWEFPD